MRKEKEVRDLLDSLCVRIGLCLSPVDIARIVEAPPNNVLAFTDAVFKAGGLDPATADRHLYRKVRDMVAASFRHATEDGV